jgi:hypothetical protein
MHSDSSTKPRPVRSALATGLRATARFCWDCVFPPPGNQLPAEFKPPPSRDLHHMEQQRHLSELSRNWPRWTA